MRKFAISVGFDYQFEWMVMHNRADLTKLRPGIRPVCSPCKRKRGPRDDPLGIEGRVHDTWRQKLVIRLYAARFESPSHIRLGEEGEGDDTYPWLQEIVLSLKNISRCVSKSLLAERRYVEKDADDDNQNGERNILTIFFLNNKGNVIINRNFNLKLIWKKKHKVVYLIHKKEIFY